VTKVHIDAGRLTFKPVPGGSGAPYTAYSFKVNDGTADSSSSYTMTINVGAVNDNPTISDITNKTILEDAST